MYGRWLGALTIQQSLDRSTQTPKLKTYQKKMHTTLEIKTILVSTILQFLAFKKRKQKLYKAYKKQEEQDTAKGQNQTQI